MIRHEAALKQRWNLTLANQKKLVHVHGMYTTRLLMGILVGKFPTLYLLVICVRSAGQAG